MFVSASWALCTKFLQNVITSYEWWSKSLHGIDTNGSGINFNGLIKGATSFPQVILTAVAFNRTLWHWIESAIVVEAKAMYHTRFIPIWMLN
ncbi:hypothetical protein H5410_010855, partial [Solanum commersonii]